MKYAIVKNGVVVNVVVLTAQDAAKDPDAVPLNGRTVWKGDEYDGYDFYHEGVKSLSLAAKLAEALEALRILGVEDE